MENKQALPLTFAQTLNLHSHQKVVLSQQQIPIYQMSEVPYDFYLCLELEGGARNLEFYQSLANLGKPIVQIAEVQVLPVQCSFWSGLLGKESVNSGDIKLYMKYYNFSLNDWVQLKKNSGGYVSQGQVLYVLKTLLSIAVAFKDKYHQPAEIFQSKNILLTNTRKIVLYPTLFKVQQIEEEVPETHRSTQNSDKCIRKQVSTGTNSSESTLQSSRVYQLKNYSFMDSDLRDLFLLVLELIALKPKDYFFSKKHGMIKIDLVRQYINNKEFTEHLTQDFVCVLEQVLQRKILNCEALLQKIEEIEQISMEVLCLGKGVYKDLSSKRQLKKEEPQNERPKKISKTFYLGQISPLQKRNSMQ